MLHYTFFQHALIGSLLCCIICAMIGTYIVTRRMVIAGGGMAHAALGGVGIGAYFGFSPLWGAAAFALLSGLGIEALTRRRVREDSAIAMIWTLGMSVGILFAYLTPGFMTDLPAYLFGDVLAVSRNDLVYLSLLAVVTGVFFAVFMRLIIAVAYDRDFAQTRHLPVRLIEVTLTALTALAIVGCLHTVGIVLVISLLSVPQMTAALFVRTFRGIIWLSAVFGYVGCLCGLWLSAFIGVPSGAAIILSAITLYFVCRAIKTLCLRFNKYGERPCQDSLAHSPHHL